MKKALECGELDFIQINTRYTMLSQEIIDLLSKIEEYKRRGLQYTTKVVEEY